MAYGLQTQTYNYETLLNIIDSSTKGLTVTEMKRDHGIHPQFDIKGALTWRGIKKLEAAGEQPHVVTKKINKTVALYTLSKGGKAHLKNNAYLIQGDLESVRLHWKEGHGPDGASPKQTRMPLAPKVEAPAPVVLSKRAQRASDNLNQAIIVNHSYFSAIEQISNIANTALTENEIDEELIAQGGGVGEVLSEAVIFNNLLHDIIGQLSEHLTEDDEEQDEE